MSLSLSLSRISGVVSGWCGDHGEAVAVCNAGGCHGSAGTDLPEALRMSDPVTQPGNPLCQERSTLCTTQHWQAHSGAAAGRQLCHKVTHYINDPTSRRQLDTLSPLLSKSSAIINSLNHSTDITSAKRQQDKTGSKPFAKCFFKNSSSRPRKAEACPFYLQEVVLFGKTSYKFRNKLQMTFLSKCIHCMFWDLGAGKHKTKLHFGSLH